MTLQVIEHSTLHCIKQPFPHTPPYHAHKLNYNRATQYILNFKTKSNTHSTIRIPHVKNQTFAAKI